MKRVGKTIVVALTMFVVTPAFGQTTDGRNPNADIGPTPNAYKNYGAPADTPEVTARIMLARASRCALNDVPSSVRKVLATTPASKAETKAVKSMEGVTPKCFADDRGETPPILVRNALAEASYRTKYLRSAPDVSSQTKTLPDSFGIVGPNERGTSEQEGAWTLAALANCTVFASSQGARGLITVPIGVPEEQQQFDALKPAMSECMKPDQLAVLTPAIFRGYLADALWRQAEKAAK